MFTRHTILCRRNNLYMFLSLDLWFRAFTIPRLSVGVPGLNYGVGGIFKVFIESCSISNRTEIGVLLNRIDGIERIN